MSSSKAFNYFRTRRDEIRCKISVDISIAVTEPDFSSRQRFAKALQIIFESGRRFVFGILKKRKGDDLNRTIRNIKWKGQLKNHVERCLLKSGRNITEDDMDISMLFTIFQKGNILTTSEKPTKGWKQEQMKDKYVQLGDDIVRLKILRNKICHNPFASMTKNDFDSLVEEVRVIMSRWPAENGAQIMTGVIDIINRNLTEAEVNDIVHRIIQEIRRANAKGTFDAHPITMPALVNNVTAFVDCFGTILSLKMVLFLTFRLYVFSSY